MPPRCGAGHNSGRTAGFCGPTPGRYRPPGRRRGRRRINVVKTTHSDPHGSPSHKITYGTISQGKSNRPKAKREDHQEAKDRRGSFCTQECSSRLGRGRMPLCRWFQHGRGARQGFQRNGPTTRKWTRARICAQQVPIPLRTERQRRRRALPAEQRGRPRAEAIVGEKGKRRARRKVETGSPEPPEG